MVTSEILSNVTNIFDFKQCDSYLSTKNKILHHKQLNLSHKKVVVTYVRDVVACARA